jgi:post-segregation antitoxin (ccd killing protein)
MTTVQIQLPDELAQDAQAAGLLTSEAMAAMLREQLRRPDASLRHASR